MHKFWIRRVDYSRASVVAVSLYILFVWQIEEIPIDTVSYEICFLTDMLPEIPGKKFALNWSQISKTMGIR